MSICCPSGAGFRPPAEFGTPARRAARWGRLWGCAPFAAPLASPPKHPLRGLYNLRRVARATRHLLRELPSLATLAQVISLRAALMPEDAFTLNVRPFQPDPPNIIVNLWITFTFFPIALNILTSPRADKFWQQTNICTHRQVTNGNFRSATTRPEVCESEKSIYHQKLVVGSPSLNSPERSEGDGWC